MRRPDVALIGAGGIARSIAAYAREQGSFRLVGALTRHADRDSSHWPKSFLFERLPDLLAQRPTVVVECASHEAATQHVPVILGRGIPVILASTGSLADGGFLDAVLSVAGTARLIIPAGALAGIDGLSAAARGLLHQVRLTTEKPIQAWADTPAARCIDLTDLTEPLVFFEGTAREAATLYPRNANVAAAVALAGVGFDRTEVRLVADPRATVNTHRLEARGDFGRLCVEVQGNPSTDNLRTSRLTALSIVRAIELESCTPVV